MYDVNMDDLLGVFSVEVTRIGNTILVTLVPDEGSGYSRKQKFSLVRDARVPVPAQVELALMELNCVPTWLWDQDRMDARKYFCQFSLSPTYKEVRDSRAYKF